MIINPRKEGGRGRVRRGGRGGGEKKRKLIVLYINLFLNILNHYFPLLIISNIKGLIILLVCLRFET